MYPTIISTEEVVKINEIVDEVEEELAKAQIPYKILEQGIMIETPSAVMVSDELSVSPSMVLKVRQQVRRIGTTEGS